MMKSVSPRPGPCSWSLEQMLTQVSAAPFSICSIEPQMLPHWTGPPFREPSIPAVPGTQCARHWERRQLTLPCPPDQPWDWKGSSKLSGFGTPSGCCQGAGNKINQKQGPPMRPCFLWVQKKSPDSLGNWTRAKPQPWVSE